MSSDLFHLRRINDLKLDQKHLDREIRKLRKLTAGWDDRGSIDSPDLVEELRKRMQEGVGSNRSFDDYTAVKRRESLLLTLYLSDLADVTGREWLPAFDKKVAISILGSEPGTLKKHLRRMATQLYFTHYDEERLPCLVWLATFLKNSWVAAGDTTLDPISKAWVESAETLFGKDAPEKVAAKWNGEWGVKELADHFHIHEGGLFRERLLEALILRQLREASHDAISADLDRLVTDAKERKLRSGYPLGAEAVRILVNRSKTESGSRVPDAWREQLVAYACDPRVPNMQDQAKWWGWASSSEVDIAIRALSELTLHEFIKLLERSLRGTAAQHQFPERRDVLLKLFEIGKVIEARLVVHQDLYHRMDSKTKMLLRPSWVSGGPQHSSFICLRCSDKVFLVEGTHSFALRGFVGENSFPIANFWTGAPAHYHDSRLRVPEIDCMIYQRHHNGDWVWDFEQQLRRRRIEWRGI